jgi:hypothetical protein
VAQIAQQLSIDKNKVYRALIKLGIREKPAGSKPQGVYLFNGMVKAADGKGYVMATWLSMDRPLKILKLVGEKTVTFPYFVLEAALLHSLEEINPKEILPGANGHDAVIELEREKEGVRTEIDLINADIKENGYSPNLSKRLRQLEAHEGQVDQQLEVAKQRQANPLSSSWGEFKSLADALQKTPNQEETRVRLRAAIRRIVHSIWLRVVPGSKERFCSVHIVFKGDESMPNTVCPNWLEIDSTTGDVTDLETGEVAPGAADKYLKRAFLRTCYIHYKAPRNNGRASQPAKWRVISTAWTEKDIYPEGLSDPVRHFERMDSWGAELGHPPIEWHDLPG